MYNYGAYINGYFFLCRVKDQNEALPALWQQALISDLRAPVHMDKIQPFLIRYRNEATS